jgi:predicted aldo/keto reductase-like oxidoreductase
MLVAGVAAPISLSYQSASADSSKHGAMRYRRLGRTELEISEVSLGSSPSPDWGVLRLAIDRGVNYIDTSHTYENGNAERKIGRLFTEVGRDKIHVGTKFHLRGEWSEESIIHTLEGSLERLQTDYVDILMIHGAKDETLLTDARVLSAFEKLRKQGKIRFNGLSCHANHEKVVRRVVECGHYDVVTLAYNAFDIEKGKKDIPVYEDYLKVSGTEALIKLARSKDLGIIAMKTLKIGGPQQNLERYKTGATSIYQAMLKWVLDNQDVSTLITEILTFEQLEEDLAVSGSKLTAAERRALHRFVADRSQDYCHLCGSCQSACPAGIRTTSIQRYLAYHESYGKHERACHCYGQLKPIETPRFCQDCGSCEDACPYGVAVRSRIKRAHHLLS